MPICWIAAHEGKPLIAGNGSGFMLDAGAGPFLVTAAHVYRAYLKARQERGDTVCVVEETVLPLEERLIAFDTNWDVATFRVAREEVEHFRRTKGRVSLTGSQREWPPKPPQEGRGIFFAGFPGDGRTMREYRGGSRVEVDYLGYTALAVADSVSPVGISTVLQHDPRLDIGLRPEIPPDWALGGCSGAPLLTFVEHNGVFSWRLGGIIYEAGATIVKASRADCLNPDGTINRHPNLAD